MKQGMSVNTVRILCILFIVIAIILIMLISAKIVHSIDGNAIAESITGAAVESSNVVTSVPMGTKSTTVTTNVTNIIVPTASLTKQQATTGEIVIEKPTETSKGEPIQQSGKKEDIIYIVKWNDTLCDISRKFGVSVDEIAEYNHIRNVNLIYTNSVLRIPAK